jgi:hypothetical protein
MWSGEREELTDGRRSDVHQQQPRLNAERFAATSRAAGVELGLVDKQVVNRFIRGRCFRKYQLRRRSKDERRDGRAVPEMPSVT